MATGNTLRLTPGQARWLQRAAYAHDGIIPNGPNRGGLRHYVVEKMLAHLATRNFLITLDGTAYAITDLGMEAYLDHSAREIARKKRRRRK